MKAPRANRYRDSWAGDLRADAVGDRKRVAGWVHRRRDHGGLIFIDLRDRTGLLQLVFRPDDAPEAHEQAHDLRAEDVISVAGAIAPREEGTVNPKLPTGEIELNVAEFELLSDAETPPFPIDEDSEVGDELRLRYRYLDLRRERMRRNIELRHDVVTAIREHLNAEGFLEIETPILTRSTPEGARDYLVPSRLQRGSWYALPQSPQLFKQLLMVAGFERYYQIPRCFRDEDFRADRQPEFTQLDMELSFVEEEDVISTCDPLIKAMLAVGGVDLELPIERMTYDEAMLRYGTDRPDRRLGMEIHELGDVFGASEFKVFSGAIADGGVVRGLRARGGEFPRSRMDTLTERAQELGAKGLVWAVVEPEGWRSPIAKFLSDDEMTRAGETLGAAEGDALFIVADQAEVAARVLGGLRLELADGAPEGHDLVWITDFPMFGWNEDEKRWDAAAPPLHLAVRRPRRRPRQLAQPRLRRGPRRLGDRRRVDPHQPPGRPAEGLRRARDRPGGGAGALRLPARRAALRRAAARRDRVRPRPHRDAARGRDIDPRRDRLPEDGRRRRPADRRPGAGGRAPAAGAGREGSDQPPTNP